MNQNPTTPGMGGGAPTQDAPGVQTPDNDSNQMPGGGMPSGQPSMPGQQPEPSAPQAPSEPVQPTGMPSQDNNQGGTNQGGSQPA